MILKESPLSIPRPIRYSMISSRVQIHEPSVAVPDLIRSCALWVHTSVPCERPDILIRSDSERGLASLTIWITKSVPNSGTPRQPSGHPPISSGLIPSACVPANRLITSGSSRGTSVALNALPVSWGTSSSSIRIILGSSCPRISSLRRFSSIE